VAGFIWRELRFGLFAAELVLSQQLLYRHDTRRSQINTTSSRGQGAVACGRGLRHKLLTEISHVQQQQQLQLSYINSYFK